MDAGDQVQEGGAGEVGQKEVWAGEGVIDEKVPLNSINWDEIDPDYSNEFDRINNIYSRCL